jgi:integrase
MYRTTHLINGRQIAMRVRLKGLNSVRKRLSDGTSRTYWYAWKGGPKLEGDPGTPEFIASYNRAVSARKVAPAGALQSIIQAYQASSEFDALSPRSRSDYKKLIKVIEAEFADFSLSALEDRRTRGEFMAWRDRRAAVSRRQADYAFAVLARVLSWSLDRGKIAVNPCERAGRVYRSQRIESIWTDDDEAAFLLKAPVHLHLALTLALWTGQRQGDLLRLPWNAYDGQRIRLKQRKTGARVSIPVGAPLKIVLDAAKKRAVTILATESGTSWTESGFRASWRKACAKAGVVGVTFHDLRGTAVTRLALADCSEAEIATITGHSMRDVSAILDAHYLKRDGGLADSAIRKLETRTKLPTGLPTAG